MNEPHMRFAYAWILSFIGSVSLLVHASDSRIHPGSECAPENETMSWFLGTSHGIVNAEPGASGTTFFICPIVHDDTDHQPDTVRVRVTDDHNSSAITCFLANCDDLSESCSTGATSSSTGTTGAIEDLNLSMPATDFDYGPYSIVCAVPKDPGGFEFSSISSYWVQEPNP